MSNCDTLEKDMRLKLKEILDDVNKWLAFAETKNGAIIALNGALLAGLVNIMLNKDFNGYFGIWVKIPLYISSLCSVLAITFSLISFLPQLSVFKENEPCSVGNCILNFYGDIAKYKSANQYMKDIYKQYYGVDKEENQLLKIELDYAKELIINSCITVKKYRWFRLSLQFTISAVVTPIPVIIGKIIIFIINKIN
ncbi:Pycsar system effector family protein [Clostridium botulinum]|uniref:Pycsar system effector family protein n=1 Tax=Clostridium botulinum TaxID=1491 RepID=UPI0004D3EBF2|nr:Pycsar system effector family protein [Clostridium botulinum]KEI04088.1 hypothetical protein Z953_03180 [Clostridium botulinum D str. 16868]